MRFMSSVVRPSQGYSTVTHRVPKFSSAYRFNPPVGPFEKNSVRPLIQGFFIDLEFADSFAGSSHSFAATEIEDAIVTPSIQLWNSKKNLGFMSFKNFMYALERLSAWFISQAKSGAPGLLSLHRPSCTRQDKPLGESKGRISHPRHDYCHWSTPPLCPRCCRTQPSRRDVFARSTKLFCITLTPLKFRAYTFLPPSVTVSKT